MGGHGWGETDDNELIDAVHVALDRGINFFDTADIYGLGKSETLLGKALGANRPNVIVATKFGVRLTETGTTVYDNAPAWIRQAVEGSLQRLKTDYIDLYQLHYWDQTTPLGETFNVLERLRTAGKIRAFGVTNVNLLQHGFNAPVTGCASLSFEYSLAQREKEAAIRKHIETLGTAFFSWGSLGQGVLSGKYHADTSFGMNDRRRRDVYVNFHAEKFRRNLNIVDTMKHVRQGYPTKTLSQIALRWILDQIPFSLALVGIKRPAQLLDNLGALDWTLSSEAHSSLCKVSDAVEAVS
jgi:aryl-alcohol dehydrogenase-like predicted oxidoreductase